MRIRIVTALALIAAATLAAAQQQRDTRAPDEILVFFGTYTTKTTSKGIYVSKLNLATGALSAPELAAESANPSFLAMHPGGRYLYAVSEMDTFDGKPGGAVSAFAIDGQTGKLTALNEQSSMGGGPAHLSVDRKGLHVLVANYGGGSATVLPIDADGKLKPSTGFVQHTGSSVNPQRQKGPHAHAINLDPSDRFAYVPDLGLDKVLIYRFDPKAGTLNAADPAFASVDPGSGPRHIAFHPDGRYAYVINEMTCTLAAFTRDANRGSLTPLQTVSTLPAGQEVAQGFSTAEVLVHASGRFLYGSNRGHDTIAVFSIDPKTGKLTLVQHESTQGRTPRGFGIDPTGAFLIAGNQRSDSVVVFRIDQKTGRLTPTGQTLQVGAPVSVEFRRPGR